VSADAVVGGTLAQNTSPSYGDLEVVISQTFCKRANEDDAIHVRLVTGLGDSFTAGNDITAFQHAGSAGRRTRAHVVGGAHATTSPITAIST